MRGERERERNETRRMKELNAVKDTKCSNALQVNLVPSFLPSLLSIIHQKKTDAGKEVSRHKREAKRNSATGVQMMLYIITESLSLSLSLSLLASSSSLHLSESQRSDQPHLKESEGHPNLELHLIH